MRNSCVETNTKGFNNKGKLVKIPYIENKTFCWSMNWEVGDLCELQSDLDTKSSDYFDKGRLMLMCHVKNIMFVWWTKCTSFIRVRLTLNQFIVWGLPVQVQYIPRNMHTVFALLCFVVVIHWLISPYPSVLLHWHCGNLTIVPVPAKQPWWIWINTSCEFIMNDCITTTKQSTTKPCAYFLGYTVHPLTQHKITSFIMLRRGLAF